MNLDYESLRLIFWALLITCIIGFCLCEGLVLGAGMLLPLLGKTDINRQRLIATLNPNLLGLQAWLVTTITLLFAAWPTVYAVLFSSFHGLLLFMLIAWIFRPLVWYFRRIGVSPAWLHYADKFLGISAYLLSIMLGIICGNLLKGIPFHLDSDMRIFFLGDFWGLLNPFSLLIAATSVSLFLMYAASYLQLKTDAGIRLSNQNLLIKSALGFLILFAVSGLWISRLEGYHVTSEILANVASNPLSKFVRRGEGLWLDNYEHQPNLIIIPALVVVSATITLYLTKLNRHYWAFIASTISVIFSVLTVAISMFPFLLPSNRSLNTSLTIWDASASLQTLSALSWIVIFALPLMALIGRFACGWITHGAPRVLPNPGLSGKDLDK